MNIRSFIKKLLNINWRDIKKQKPTAFTLIELLVAIGIIGILAAIIIIAVNPGRQFESAMDARRLEDVKALTTALIQYQIENKGRITPLNIDVCPSYSNIGSGGVNLGSFLVPNYLSSIPVDPAEGCNEIDTCYRVCVTTDSRFNVVAPYYGGAEDQQSEPSPSPSLTPTPGGPPPANPFQ